VAAVSEGSDLAALGKPIPLPGNLFAFQVFFKSHHPAGESPGKALAFGRR